MTDPGEDIADALAAYVKDLDVPDPLSLVGEIEKTDNIKKVLNLEWDQLKVAFYAVSEEAEKIGRGGEALERFTIAMLVIRKINAEYTKAKLAQYVREIKKQLRGISMAGCRFTSDATPVKCDADQLNDHNQFCSISEFTYSTAG